MNFGRFSKFRQKRYTSLTGLLIDHRLFHVDAGAAAELLAGVRTPVGRQRAVCRAAPARLTPSA